MSRAPTKQERCLSAICALVLTGALAASSATVAGAQPAADETAVLMERASTWFARDRPDMAREVLGRLFRVDPDNADGLALLAEVELRSGQVEAAQAALARLRAADPAHPGIARVETMLRLEGPDHDRLQQARLLARSGQTAAALAAFRALYPDGPPGGDLALEYWQLVAESADGWSAARAGLAQLVQEQPENLRYRLALAEHQLSRRPIDLDALRTVIEMSRLPEFARQAHAAWRRAVMRLDDTPENLAWLRSYLAQAPQDTAVRDRLAEMTQRVEERRRLLADPAYQTGRQGLALLESGDLAGAEKSLQDSLGQRPNDPEVIGGMGLLRLRQGRHADAEALFQRALELDAANASKWRSLTQTARFWGAMRRSEEALAAGDAALAERHARAALDLDSRSGDALVALARAQLAAGRPADARDSLRRALDIAPTDGPALRTLLATALAEDRSPGTIDRLVAELTPVQRAAIADDIAAVRTSLMREEADRLVSSGQTADAMRLLQRAIEIDPADPWLNYDLARLHQRSGNPERGTALLDALLAHPGARGDAVQAAALFQLNLGDPKRALAIVEAVPAGERDGSLAALERRIRVRLHVAAASALAADSRRDEATRELTDAEQVADDDPELLVDVALAWMDIEQYSQGEALLAAVAERLQAAGDATPPDRLRKAQVRLLEAQARQHLRKNGLDNAVSALQQAVELDDGDDPWLRLDLARLLYRQGRIEQGLDVMTAQVAKHPGDPDSRFALALYQSQADQLRAALDTLEHIPAAERTDAMVRMLQSLQDRHAMLLGEQARWLTGGLEWTHRSASPGKSQMDAYELPVEFRRPLGERGRLYVRTSLMSVDAGTVDLADARNARGFGSVLLCQPDCDTGRFAQDERGIGLMAAYEFSRSTIDLGVSPAGFAVVRPTGGLRHGGHLGPVSYSLELSSRPVTSSFLSYAGTRDPRTGTVWGGVQANGLSATFSRDDGGAFGAWALLGAHRFTGRHVLDNDRVQAMAGAYWRIINDPDRLLQVGLNAMTWGYSENAGEFTFGHGGYFSPESYRSISLPITYGRSWPRFSYTIRAAASTSRTRMAAAPYFPTDPAMQADAVARAPITGVDPFYEASRGGGRGYKLEAVMEHQLSSQLFVGLHLAIEQSRDYEPSSLMIYLRRSLDRVPGRPMQFPPEPFVPTSEY